MQKQSLVKRGYNKLAKRYDLQRKKNGYPNKGLLTSFIKSLNKKGNILDLGCGAGVPVSKFLVEKGNTVTGIDISENMIKIAKKNVPDARFIKMDMTRMKFKSDSFDGAVSFYAIIHIPRSRHKTIYQKLHKIIKRNGIILVANGTNSGEYYGEFMGEKMFWSHYAPKKALEIIEDAGFEIIWGKLLRLGGEMQFWILAKNLK
ncbi:MAG: methyltransferase domain-containing protein [Candidatus Micrarchaeota archaeon]|nr:methyltransferase domain-containing protein [Candidatus Micrarchaeota archaeon]